MDVTTRGNLTVNAFGNFELLDLDCDNVALQTLAASGSILPASGSILLSATGSVLVSDDVIAGNDGTTNSTGSVEIQALGVASNITVNDVVLTDNGEIRLLADNDLRVGAPISTNEATDTDNLVVITSVDGVIRLVADANGDANGSGGEIFMIDASRVIAGRAVANDYLPGVDGMPSPSTVTLGTTAKTWCNAKIRMQADQ